MARNIHINRIHHSPLIRVFKKTIRRTAKTLRENFLCPLIKPEISQIRIIKRGVPPIEEQGVPSIKEHSNSLPEENIFKILTIDDKKISFCRQTTPANCGPLSIINGLNALSTFNEDFAYPEHFPKTSSELRKWLGDNLPRYGINIGQNTTPLFGGAMYEIVDRIPNLTILADEGFTVNSRIDDGEKNTIIDNADWIIKVANNHYASFVRKNKESWLVLDSLYDGYREISDITLKSQLAQPENRYFMAIRVYRPKSVKIVRN